MKNTSWNGKGSYIESGIQSFQLSGRLNSALTIIHAPHTGAQIPLNQFMNVESPRESLIAGAVLPSMGVPAASYVLAFATAFAWACWVKAVLPA